MTIAAFQQLKEEEKLKVLMSSGRVISERQDNENRSFLYYLGNFYACVQYRKRTDELTGIRAFDEIGPVEKLKWKVLRILPGLQ